MVQCTQYNQSSPNQGATKNIKNVSDQMEQSSRYYPSFKPAEMVGISGRALGKITSNFTAITSDHQKNNLGLSLKYEAKGLKVIDYSRKKAIELPREYSFFSGLTNACMMKAADALPGPDPDGQVKEINSWLKSKGVRDFEAVSFYCDQLTKETVAEIEASADTITKSKSPGSIKKAIVKSIPRQAVLRPSHVAYRLQNQHFALGDRVTMVQGSGGVPLSVEGVVVDLNGQLM
ncbi:hypothetical protein BYT27DRAFT_7286147 [Phlegmacium glaucopus]|nr:hypothetical protein BYT27DRAFT_7286147 [Phlegmacium glaucopus]